jgi:beta-aspartyl-peptidase (threonine type)
LTHIVTDSHFDTRQRLGRLIAFVVKARTLAPHTKLSGLGIDENACVTVEADGEAHFYADSPDKHAWLVTGGSVRDLRAGKPLNDTGVHVTGINAGSQFNVLTQHIESPAFERIYDVRDGVLARRISWSLSIHGGAGVSRIDKSANIDGGAET